MQVKNYHARIGLFFGSGGLSAGSITPICRLSIFSIILFVELTGRLREGRVSFFKECDEELGIIIYFYFSLTSK